MMTVERLWGGAGGRGEACRSMQILQIMVRRFAHAQLPLQACGESQSFAPPANPCDGYGLLLVGLLALQYSGRLDGLLVCLSFATWFALLNFFAETLRALWMLVLKASIFDSEAEKGIRSSCPNCHLGCLVPPF